jgi:hypothetical protein
MSELIELAVISLSASALVMVVFGRIKRRRDDRRKLKG